MHIRLIHIDGTARRRTPGPEAQLVEEYRARAEQYTPCSVRAFASADAMLLAAAREGRRQPVRLVLLDAAGEMLTSRDFAERLRRFRDGGVPEVWLAVGPADGWTRDTLARADLRLSFGPLTLPHRLAQTLLAEQVYRALTILAGHPYHCGH